MDQIRSESTAYEVYEKNITTLYPDKFEVKYWML